MTAVAILWIIICIGIGVSHPELAKLVLFLSWGAMALLAIGSTIMSLLRLA